jgi:hypothetical protein
MRTKENGEGEKSVQSTGLEKRKDFLKGLEMDYNNMLMNFKGIG